jgi:F-type H+-transporting ATPase subunit b
MSEILHNPEFWVAVSFVIGVGLIWWKGAGSVTKLLDDRSAKIAADLAEAERLRTEAERLLADYQRRRDEATQEAAAIAERSKADAERLAAKAARDLDAALARRETLAHERIAQAEAAAVAEVRQVAIDVAIAATRRIIVDGMDGQQSNRLIDEAIAELPKRLH